MKMHSIADKISDAKGLLQDRSEVRAAKFIRNRLELL